MTGPSAADGPAIPPWAELEAAATQAVAAALRDLPPPLATVAAQVPITFEPYPNAALLAEGLDEDLLGLFVGDDHNGPAESSPPLPPQIILFLENLYLYALEDSGNYLHEVTLTFLHELGHYLGLDEDALMARGLE